MLSTATQRFAGPDYAGHIGTMVDITQHRRDREQGLAAQKLESLGVLAGGVAHDFNNLLGSILANSELLLADLPADAPAREGIDRINAVAVRAAEIVRELMTFAGHENPIFEPVSISSLVREMLELLKVSISKLAVIRVDLADGLPAVMANASQIRQVVMNLITNASEALGKAHGVISVSSDMRRVLRDDADTGELAEGEYVRLRVSDTGCGMTKEIQDRIFDPFFSTKFSGRGLGLAAVQGIVRSHRGAIQLTSAPGEGTCFEVLLPCAPPNARPPDEARVPEPAPATASAATTVLVVEDEEVLRAAVCKMLRKKDFIVIEAADGNAALEALRGRAAEIGVILLDMTLPGISGKQLFEELRAIRPEARVILTTAYSKEMAANALGSLEAWGFIRKPYHISDLVAMLRSAGE
uniref:histidine kinase n=1 Tax=Solibacter usitatus (strain Ellin6076) TaxID=234267 RepID=Q023H0_SOLUE